MNAYEAVVIGGGPAGLTAALYLVRSGVKTALVEKLSPGGQVLMEEFSFDGQLDIIFCRNVVIYFDRQTQEMLFSRFCRKLAVGGYLFIGHSESLAGMHLAGDATDDALLVAAGIKRARSIVTALTDEAANVYVTLTARQLNPDIFIVARAGNASHITRLEFAGANKVVLPHLIGGVRMDRDKHYERNEPAYLALACGQGVFAPGAAQAVQSAYAAGETDEFVKPRVVADGTGAPIGRIMEGNPILRDGQNTVRGDVIKFYIHENRSEVLSGTQRRVEAIFYSPSKGEGK